MIETQYKTIPEKNSEFDRHSNNSIISVGICTSNDESTINNVLKDLIKKSQDKELNIREVIIVSSGCIDKTEFIIEKYIESYPDFIRLIVESKRNGKSSALNIIFNSFKGDALILLPADVVLGSNSLIYLKKKLYSNQMIGVVSGKPILLPKLTKNSIIGKISGIIWRLHNQTLSLNSNTHATGELMIIRRNALVQIPSFIINDDAYIALETVNKEFAIAFEKKSHVFISVPTTLYDYIMQRRRVLTGHKQIYQLKNKNTTTFREIFRTQKILGLKLLLREIRNVKTLYYFVIAVVIESYIECYIALSRKDYFKQKGIWKRVKTTAPISKELS